MRGLDARDYFGGDLSPQFGRDCLAVNDARDHRFLRRHLLPRRAHLLQRRHQCWPSPEIVSRLMRAVAPAAARRRAVGRDGFGDQAAQGFVGLALGGQRGRGP